MSSSDIFLASSIIAAFASSTALVRFAFPITLSKAQKRLTAVGRVACSTLNAVSSSVKNSGIFFALLAFAPPFRIEGPETFYRFQTAAMTGQAIIAAVVLAMFLRDRRSGWPYLLAGGSYLVAEAANAWLTHLELIDPLTRLVATPGKAAAFLVALALVAALLAALVWPRGSGRHPPSRPVAVAGDVAGDKAV